MPVIVYSRDPERIEAYQIGIRRSRVPRIDWQMLLGVSFTRFVFLNRDLTDDEIIRIIMAKCYLDRNNPAIADWRIEDIEKNIKDSLSARRAEMKTYGR